MPKFLKWGNHDAYYFRDFRNAYQYRPDIAPPRQKFQGYVNFVLNRKLINSFDDSTTFRTRISSLVKTASLPSVDFKTETKNVFNRKKVINTGVEYSPVSVTVYDTIQNEWIVLFMKYFSYLYMNPRNKFSGRDRDPSTVYDTFTEYLGDIGNKFGQGSTRFDSNQYGYNLPLTANFFERIDMILYHGNKGIQYSMIKPTMTAFKTNDIDYSDSNFLNFELEFDYESFTTSNVLNFDLSDTDKERFEDVSDVDLPGTHSTSTIPIALQEVQMDTLGDADSPRRRTAQIIQSSTPNDRPLSDANISIDPTYVDSPAAPLANTSLLDKIEDFLEDTPFGRVVDSAITGAIHGVVKEGADSTDVGDSVKSAVFGSVIDEVVDSINQSQDN